MRRVPATSDASRVPASVRAGGTALLAPAGFARVLRGFDLVLLGIACTFSGFACGCRPEPPPRTVPVRPLGAAAPADTPLFLARLEFPTSGPGRAKPVRVLAGDLDGDGKDEIVAATRSPGGIEIWSGISPVLAPAPEPRRFSFGDYPIGPVWVGAPDGGGARSAAAIASRETLELLVVDLGIALRAKPEEPLPLRWRARLPARPRAIASGDLGRDDVADVAVVTIEEELLLYAGSRDAESPRRVPLPREHAVALLIASDGVRIAVGFQASRKVALLRSDGTVETSAPLLGIPRGFAEADLDGDGDTELAVVAGDASLEVFGLGRRGGPARWLEAAPLEVKVGTVPIALATPPADSAAQGGAAPLAVLEFHAQDVRLFDFSRGAASPLGIRAAGQKPTDVAAGDFDGDGALDVAVANGDARRVGVLFGGSQEPREGKCFASETRVPCDRSPASIAAGDVDGDGRLDVAVLAAADETLSVLANEGGKLSRRAASVPAPGAGVVACGDLDGDGRAEAACLLGQGEQTHLAVLHDGSLVQTKLELDRGGQPPDLVLVRPWKDGPAFALLPHPETNAVDSMLVSFDQAALELRPGDGRFSGGGAGPRALALVRDGDEKLRVAVADGGPGEPRGVTLLDVSRKAGGELELKDPVALAMRQHPFAIASGDLDGDGRQDLAVLASESGGDSQGFVVPWLCGTDGAWRALDPMPTGGRPHRIATSDLDGDGKAEILVTAQGSHHVEVWLARAGDPVQFLRAPDIGAGTGPLDLIAVDLDGDGKDEIVVANGFSDDLSVLNVK